jgi:DHA1 family tetracycline resistance protein-like MFS transporter
LHFCVRTLDEHDAQLCVLVRPCGSHVDEPLRPDKPPEPFMHLIRFIQSFAARGNILAVSVFLNFAGFTLIIPVLPFSVARYVAAPAVAFWVALILAVYALCSFLAAPVLGALSDRHGRRPVILLSLLGSAFGFALFGLGGALWVLLLGRIIEGLTAGSISAMYACIADTHAPAERGAAFGKLGAAGGLGFMLGPVLGGALGQLSLAAPLYGAALLSLMNALWIFYRLPESHPRERRSTQVRLSQFNAIGQLLACLQLPPLRRLFEVVFCFALGSALLQSNLAVLLKDVLAFTPAAIGLVLSGIGVMDIVRQGYAAPRLLPRFGERRVAAAGLLVNGAGLLALALLAGYPVLPLLIGGIVLLVFGDGLFQPSASALVANHAPSGQQGQVQGANQAQQSIAHMGGPLVGAWLYGVAAGAPYLVAALVVGMGAGLLLTRGRPSAERSARA